MEEELEEEKLVTIKQLFIITKAPDALLTEIEDVLRRYSFKTDWGYDFNIDDV